MIIYLLTAIGLFLLVLNAVGCMKNPKPDPTPTPEPQRTEVPQEILSIMTSPEAIVRWGKQNYNMSSDEAWSGHADYPLTPAEFFMRKIKCFRCYNHIITKPPYVGDCNTVNPLNAYFLSKIGWDAYVAIIPNFSQDIAHMFCFALKDGKCIVINNIWLYTNFSTPEAWIASVYPGKTIRDKIPIQTWLDSLYSKGHHQYYDEVVG